MARGDSYSAKLRAALQCNLRSSFQSTYFTISTSSRCALYDILRTLPRMAATTEYVRLAQSLPPRLLSFFARFPPTTLSRAPIHAAATPINTAINTSSQDPNAGHEEAIVIAQPPKSPKVYNPFKAHKHHLTGVWHNSRFSLRQQADLVKLARNHGVEELLPYTPKKTDVRLRKREQLGLRVKGTGEGQKVKGKKHERTMKARLDRRKQAILEMPAMIEKWKEVRTSPPGFRFPSNAETGWSWTWLEEMAQMSGHSNPDCWSSCNMYSLYLAGVRSTVGTALFR